MNAPHRYSVEILRTKMPVGMWVVRRGTEFGAHASLPQVHRCFSVYRYYHLHRIDVNKREHYSARESVANAFVVELQAWGFESPN